MITLRSYFVAGVLALSAIVTSATTTEMKRGPQCQVEKEVDSRLGHLFQIYVTPPKASDSYSPGHVRVYLERRFPEHLYVPLDCDKLPDGRLHVQIAVQPEKVDVYYVNVLDDQKPEMLLLFSQKLSDIPMLGKK